MTLVARLMALRQQQAEHASRRTTLARIATLEHDLHSALTALKATPPKAAPGPRGPKGDPGPKGDKGATGEPGTPGQSPAHQWRGSSLRFQNPNGTWGKYVNLRGPSGPAGVTWSIDPTDPIISEDGQMYAVQIDFDGAYIYRGEAEPGTAETAPAWRIRRLAIAPIDGDVSMTWANGSADFTQAWTDRLALGYS